MGEDEIVEIVVVEQFPFHQLVGFFQHAGHVGHIPMANVGAEHGFQARAERVHPAVEPQRH